MGFFGINSDSSKENLNLPGYNLWYMPCGKDYDLQKMIDDYKSDSDIKNIEDMYLFISFPTGKSKKESKK